MNSGSQLEVSKEQNVDKQISDINNEIDDIHDKQIPELQEKLKSIKDEYGVLRGAKDYSLESIDKLIEDYKKEGVDANDYFSNEQKSLIEEMRSLQNKSDELDSKASELDESRDNKSIKEKSQSFADSIRKLKIDTKGIAMSSVPGFNEAWNCG